VKLTVLQVVLAAPRELREAELKRSVVPCRRLQHLHARLHDVGPDAVAPYCRDLDHALMLATTSGRHQAGDGGLLSRKKVFADATEAG
jgi:hypothetical protein